MGNLSAVIARGIRDLIDDSGDELFDAVANAYSEGDVELGEVEKLEAMSQEELISFFTHDKEIGSAMAYAATAAAHVIFMIEEHSDEDEGSENEESGITEGNEERGEAIERIIDSNRANIDADPNEEIVTDFDRFLSLATDSELEDYLDDPEMAWSDFEEYQGDGSFDPNTTSDDFDEPDWDKVTPDEE